MDFTHKIIQWNCRGLKPNYNEVSLLICEYNIINITVLRPTIIPKFYRSYEIPTNPTMKKRMITPSYEITFVGNR